MQNKGIIGAQAVAAMIYLVRSGEYFEKGKAFLKNHCFYDLDKIGENWKTIQRDYDFDVTCQGSVPEAIYCAMKNISLPMGYERTIREAVSLGGDADTQGAIAGGIAAAVCEVPDDIDTLSDGETKTKKDGTIYADSIAKTENGCSFQHTSTHSDCDYTFFMATAEVDYQTKEVSFKSTMF